MKPVWLIICLALAGCSDPAPSTESKKTITAPVIDLVPVDVVDASQVVLESNNTLDDYTVVADISGNLSSIGSDTLANLMTLWAESFSKIYPSINIQIQAAGSSTALPALVEGTANFGPMSRAMKDREVEAFERRYGYKPTAIKVAIDALALYVHKDNPVNELTLEQVDAMFSVTRRCGSNQEHTAWGTLGLSGSWNDRPIQLYGRNSVSGTYGYFKKVALCGGDFRNSVNEQPGSASVVQAVASSLNGIGYSGVGYITSGVKALSLSSQGSEAIEATPENALDGSYPLARYLYVYINKKPNQPLAPIEREFIRFILSSDGQETVHKDGYVPLSSQVAGRELAKLI